MVKARSSVARRGGRKSSVFLTFLAALALGGSTRAAEPSGHAHQAKREPGCSKGTLISIPARCHNHHTGIQVQKDARYEVSVVDMRGVYDLFVPVHDLRGWPWAWTRTLAHRIEHRRRMPHENWFAVIFTVNGQHAQALSAGRPWIAPATGELVCYFNDDPWAYWNNFGTARLCLTRVH